MWEEASGLLSHGMGCTARKGRERSWACAAGWAKGASGPGEDKGKASWAYGAVGPGGLLGRGKGRKGSGLVGKKKDKGFPFYEL